MKALNLLFTAVFPLVLVSSMAVAQPADRDARTQDSERVERAEDRGFTGEARDAWLTGKIETVMTLNTRLNSFRIDTDVENGRVTLSGEVESEVDKDLAGELARGVDEVDQVENNITVRTPEPARDGRSVAADRAGDDRESERNGFSQWVSDRTTTAVVKSQLLANDRTGGLDINVDTEGDIVTLTGTVESEEEKRLAEQIARDSRDVREVRNQLALEPGV